MLLKCCLPPGISEISIRQKIVFLPIGHDRFSGANRSRERIRGPQFNCPG